MFWNDDLVANVHPGLRFFIDIVIFQSRAKYPAML